MGAGNNRGAAIFAGLAQGLERGIHGALALHHQQTTEDLLRRRVDLEERGTAVKEKEAETNAKLARLRGVAGGVDDFIARDGHLRPIPDEETPVPSTPQGSYTDPTNAGGLGLRSNTGPALDMETAAPSALSLGE